MTMKNCATYCAGRLRGIVENMKLTGEIPDEFDVTIEPVRRRITWVKGGTYEMTCEHNQKFLVRPVKR